MLSPSPFVPKIELEKERLIREALDYSISFPSLVENICEKDCNICGFLGLVSSRFVLFCASMFNRVKISFYSYRR